jgi:hypothetical protein
MDNLRAEEIDEALARMKDRLADNDAAFAYDLGIISGTIAQLQLELKILKAELHQFVLDALAELDTQNNP